MFCFILHLLAFFEFYFTISDWLLVHDAGSLVFVLPELNITQMKDARKDLVGCWNFFLREPNYLQENEINIKPDKKYFENAE